MMRHARTTSRLTLATLAAAVLWLAPAASASPTGPEIPPIELPEQAAHAAEEAVEVVDVVAGSPDPLSKAHDILDDVEKALQGTGEAVEEAAGSLLDTPVPDPSEPGLPIVDAPLPDLPLPPPGDIVSEPPSAGAPLPGSPGPARSAPIATSSEPAASTSEPATGVAPFPTSGRSDPALSPAAFRGPIIDLALPAGPLAIAEAFTFPLLLAMAVGIFLVVQGRMDRRDPKLRQAPVASELMGFE